MKIAILTDTFLPQINGVVTSTKTFADEFEKLGHEVLILGPRMQGAKESTGKIWRLRSIPYPFLKEHRLIIPFSRRLQQFKHLNVDIIHAQTPFSMGYLAQFLGRKYNLPVVHTYHTFFAEYLHYVPFIPRRYMTKYAMIESKNFCNRCAAVVVPSEQMKQKLLDYKVTSPIEVIPTGVDLSQLNQIPSKQEFYATFPISPKIPMLIFAGRLGKEKNIFFLLECFQEILKKVPNAILFMAGDGPQRENMITKAKSLGIFSHMHFAGYIDRKMLFTAFSCATVMMFPSKTETQGLTVIESLAMETPVVGINQMGVADVLKDNIGGFLCEEDVSQYSQKVIDLLQNKTLHHQKQKEAKERAQEFSSDFLAQKMLKIYQQFIK